MVNFPVVLKQAAEWRLERSICQNQNLHASGCVLAFSLAVSLLPSPSLFSQIPDKTHCCDGPGWLQKEAERSQVQGQSSLFGFSW